MWHVKGGDKEWDCSSAINAERCGNFSMYTPHLSGKENGNDTEEMQLRVSVVSGGLMKKETLLLKAALKIIPFPKDPPSLV